MSRKSSRRIESLEIDSESLVRGNLSEDRVEKILFFLMEMGIIEGYYRAKPYDELDRMGADFEIAVAGRKLYLQVKSSFRGLEEHRREYGDSIPCVVVTDERDDGDLISIIVRVTGISGLVEST